MNIRSVFVTGISGYIGGTIALKLRDRNYKVLGLVRRNTDEEQVGAAGITPVRGNLERENIEGCTSGPAATS